VSSEVREKRANGTCNERYIFKCAKNHGIDFKEKHWRHDEIEVHFTPQEWEEFRNKSDIPDPEEELIRKEYCEMMDELAETLTPRQRDLYRRYFRNWESATDIAHSSGQSEQSVRQSVYRLKNRLLELIRIKG